MLGGTDHMCVCVRVCVHGHIRIKKMKEWSNHILFLLLFFLSMCPKLFVKADLLYHVYPFQQELLTVRVQGNGYTHYCLTQLLTVHVWENGYTHYCRTQHKINLKKLIIIIIMCNSYIVPNPTRLAQALHNSKREWTSESIHETCIHQTIQCQQQITGKHAHNPEQSV